MPLFHNGKIAYVGLGVNDSTQMGKRLKEEMNADTYFLSYKDSVPRAAAILDSIKAARYEKVIIGFHGLSNRPANNYGISAAAINLWDSLQGNNTAAFLAMYMLRKTLSSSASSGHRG